MLNERVKAATAIKADLIPAEDAIDITIAKLGQLAATMCTARMEAKLAASFGQEAAGHVTSAMALLGQARGHLVAAHADLGVARRKVLPTVNWGADAPKEGIDGTDQAALSHIRVA